VNKRQAIKGKGYFRVINTALWITVLIEHSLYTRAPAATWMPRSVTTESII